MSNEQVVVAASGTGGSGGDGGNFFGLLAVVTLVFAILKVNGSVVMSWWLVTLPLWVGFLIALVFMVLVMFVEGIRGLVGLNKDGEK